MKAILADYSSQMEKSISIRESWSASDEGMAPGSMEIRYAAQVLSGLYGGLCGVPSRERDRSGWRKWLLPATGTRGEGSDQSDRNLRKQWLSGFRGCR
jgi:hypothetical protein